MKNTTNNKGLEIKPIAPQLRFPEFSGSWEKKKLGDVFTFKVTNSFSRENLNYDSGEVKNIHYGDIHTKFPTLFDITKCEVPFINSETPIKRITTENYCLEGDLIFADASEDINDVGKSMEIINLDGQKLLSGLHTLLARPKEGVFGIGFKGYLFKSNNVRLQIQKESQGSKVLSINTGRLSNINLQFPSLPEQTKIASFLTAVDDKLQALKKKKEALERYKKGMMQKLFSQEIRFKDDHGNEFPDWWMERIGNLTYKVGEKNKNNIDLPVYSINNRKGFIPQSEQFEDIDSSDRGYDISMYKIVHSNTFVYNPARINVGSIAFNESLDNVIVSSLYVCFKTNETISDRFLSIYMTSSQFNNSVLRYQEGGVRQYLFFENFSAIKVPIPSKHEQNKIANFLSALDDKINQVDKQVQGMEQWKKGLLQKMFV